MTRAFTEKGLDSPRLSAEMIIAHVLGCDRMRLYMDQDRPASPLERQSLRDLTARALKHEPVQYLVGEGYFFGMPFKVDQRVLIPRPATETIVEFLLRDCRARGHESGEGLLLADVCTGSGCMAIALAKNLPKARLIATDLSAGAIMIAGENAARHGVGDRVELVEGDLLEPLRRHPAVGERRALDALTANPPYIPDHEWAAVAPNVREHEPATALRGGPDGLDLVRPLIAQCTALLTPGGVLLIELAESHAGEALALAEAQNGLEAPRILKDHEGLDRVLVARAR